MVPHGELQRSRTARDMLAGMFAAVHVRIAEVPTLLSPLYALLGLSQTTY